MIRIFLSLACLLALFGAASAAASAADYKPAKKQKPAVAPQSHQHHPHAVQLVTPFHGHGFNTFASPFYGYNLGAFGAYGAYQQPSPVVAVVDTDGVVRLIELRQLRGYQPMLQSPVQLQPQPYYVPVPAPVQTPVPIQPKP